MKNLILTTLFLIATLTVFAQSETGLASVKEDQFHGSTTAYNEKYNKNIATAAHRTLKQNTIVKVTRLDNQKTVIVRINDKGPYYKEQIIQLSRKAANAIDLTDGNPAMVKIEVIPDNYQENTAKSGSVSIINVNDPKTSAEGLYRVSSEKIPAKGYGVQLGVYSDYKNVLKQVSILKKYGYPVLVSIETDANKKDTYKLFAGDYPKLANASASKAALRKKGFAKCFVVDLSKL